MNFLRNKYNENKTEEDVFTLYKTIKFYLEKEIQHKFTS